MAPIGAARAARIGGGVVIPDSEIDNFEHEDMSIYTLANGDSLTADQTSPVLIDNASAKVDAPSSFLIAYNTPADGDLPNYPSDGDVFGGYINGGGVVPGICWATNSTGGYFAAISEVDDQLQLWRYDGGSDATNLVDQGVTIDADTWYWLQITWDSTATNRFVVEVFDVDQSTGVIADNPNASTSTDDQTYDNDGVGPATVGTANTGAYDYFAIRDSV